MNSDLHDFRRDFIQQEIVTKGEVTYDRICSSVEEKYPGAEVSVSSIKEDARYLGRQMAVEIVFFGKGKIVLMRRRPIGHAYGSS